MIPRVFPPSPWLRIGMPLRPAPVANLYARAPQVPRQTAGKSRSQA